MEITPETKQEDEYGTALSDSLIQKPQKKATPLTAPSNTERTMRSKTFSEDKKEKESSLKLLAR